jgi:O-antigen ligase
LGLPLGAVLVIAIFANLLSGWYKRADMEMKSEESSLILVLVGAAILIVAFIVVFSVRHNWDMNEQRYRELLSRRDES